MNAPALDHSDEPPASPEDSVATKQATSSAREEAGRLEVADQVVEKIAGYAVTLVPGAAAAPRRVLGIHVGQARPEEAASVSAEVHDGIASVQATIAVSWPKSVQAVADGVRRSIHDKVTALTGVEVDHVDVDVVSMTVLGAAEPRVS